MANIKIIFNACYEIFSTEINLCGYDVSLMACFAFVALVTIIYAFIKIFR